MASLEYDENEEPNVNIARALTRIANALGPAASLGDAAAALIRIADSVEQIANKSDQDMGLAVDGIAEAIAEVAKSIDGIKE